MSDLSVVGVLAEALAKHVVRETFRARSRETGERATVARCTCGSVVPDVWDGWYYREKATAVSGVVL